MNLILDTHSLLWFIGGDKQLSSKAKNAILSTLNNKYISIVSLWEIAIKMSIGKLKLDVPFDVLRKEIIENGFEILPLEFEHLQELFQLEFHHRDPFDRIIIAQARSENMTIITKDANFKLYNEAKLLW